MDSFLIIGLGILTLLSVSLQRTYARVPLPELKRRARLGNELAGAILRAVGYGHSLRAVLWFLIGISSGAFFVVLSANAPLWFALAASAVVIWFGFVWIPASRVTFIGEKLAAWCAPALAKLLSYIHPIVDRLVRLVRKYRPVHIHTGLYDRNDLLELLERQQVQPGNRIEAAELDIARHALSFGDESVAQHMTPRRVVHAVSADEPLGPVIMDELHSSGHSRFPVYEGKKDNLIGVLFLRDLIREGHRGTVRTLMKKGVSYVHEDQSLHDALQAILKTHQQLFIVVNSFEEYVGIITIEDVLETIIGKPIVDEFDQYDDLRAVAARSARVEHKEHKAVEAPVEEDLPPEEAEAEETQPEEPVEKVAAAEPDPQEPRKITHREEDIDDTIEL